MEEDYEWTTEDLDYAWDEEEALKEDEKQALDYAVPKGQQQPNEPNRCILCFHIASDIVTYVERLAPLNQSTTYLSVARRDPRQKYSALLESVDFSSSDWSGQLRGETISNLQTVLSDSSILSVALMSDNSLCCWQFSIMGLDGGGGGGVELLKRSSSSLTHSPSQICWSDDGQCLFTAQRSKLVVWDVDLQSVTHIPYYGHHDTTSTTITTNVSHLLYFFHPQEAVGVIFNGIELRIWWLLPQAREEGVTTEDQDKPAMILSLPPFGPPSRDIITSANSNSNRNIVVQVASSSPSIINIENSHGHGHAHSWRLLLCYGEGRLAVVRIDPLQTTTAVRHNSGSKNSGRGMTAAGGVSICIAAIELKKELRHLLLLPSSSTNNTNSSSTSSQGIAMVKQGGGGSGNSSGFFPLSAIALTNNNSSSKGWAVVVSTMRTGGSLLLLLLSPELILQNTIDLSSSRSMGMIMMMRIHVSLSLTTPTITTADESELSMAIVYSNRQQVLLGKGMGQQQQQLMFFICPLQTLLQLSANHNRSQEDNDGSSLLSFFYSPQQQEEDDDQQQGSSNRKRRQSRDYLQMALAYQQHQPPQASTNSHSAKQQQQQQQQQQQLSSLCKLRGGGLGLGLGWEQPHRAQRGSMVDMPVTFIPKSKIRSSGYGNHNHNNQPPPPAAVRRRSASAPRGRGEGKTTSSGILVGKRIRSYFNPPPPPSAAAGDDQDDHNSSSLLPSLPLPAWSYTYHNNAINGLCFSPDGHRLILSPISDPHVPIAIKLPLVSPTNSNSNKETLFIGHSAAIRSCHLSSSNSRRRLMITASDDHTANIWQVSSSSSSATSNNSSNKRRSLSATASSLEKGGSGRLLMSLTHRHHRSSSLLNTTTTTMATADNKKNNNNRRFDSEIKRAQFFYGDSTLLLAHRSALLLYAYRLPSLDYDDNEEEAGGGSYRLLHDHWDLKALTNAQSIMTFAAFNHISSAMIICGTSDRAVHFLDAHSGRLMRTVNRSPHDRGVVNIAIPSDPSPHLQQLDRAAYELFATTGQGDGLACLWDIRSSSVAFRCPVHTAGSSLTVALSPCLRYLATAGDGSRMIRVMDIRGGKEVTSLVHHSSSTGNARRAGVAVTAIAFNPLGPLLASAASDRSLSFWADPHRPLAMYEGSSNNSSNGNSSKGVGGGSR